MSDEFQVITDIPDMSSQTNRMGHFERLYWQEMREIVKMQNETERMKMDMIELKKERAQLRLKNKDLKRKYHGSSS